MTRPLRIEYPGALYHITARGNNQEPIFHCDEDRKLLLTILATTIRTHNWICHAYCLMNNHYHLCLETPEANLSIGMRDLNGIYAQSINKRYQTIGHIFQDRFNSFLIEKEAYLLNVVSYIVLNPVRAKLVVDPKDWIWSNYRATAGLGKSPSWLETNWTRKLFSKNQLESTTKYQAFVLSQNNEVSPFEKIQEGKILGSPQFIHKVWEENQETDKITEVPKPERTIGRPSLEDIFVDISDKEARNDAIRFAKRACGYPVTEIARHLNLSQTLVSLIYRDKIDHHGNFIEKQPKT